MRRWWITGAVLAVAFLAVACGGGDDGAGGEVTTEESAETSVPDADAEAVPDAGKEPGAASSDTEPDDAGQDPDSDGSEAQGSAPEPSDEAAALPTQEALEDPCADDAGREDEVFIDLVAPVMEQQVDGQVDVVGCANVNEGTVSYRVLDGDGRTLDEGFFTASCGTGCVGEFRDTVDLGAAEGEPVAYLQFYSESMADGSEQALTEVMVVLA